MKKKEKIICKELIKYARDNPGMYIETKKYIIPKSSESFLKLIKE